MEEYRLPKLPYEYGALEPYIDEATMRLHHSKHHQAYVDKFNAALASVPEFRAKVKSAEKLLEDLNAVPESIRAAVRNHGGGAVNHSFFWSVLSGERQSPQGEVSQEIGRKFGGIEKFKEAFSASAAGVFGSGWCWLVAGAGGLEIMTTPNQDSPLSFGKKPLLALDVWEHAYYLKYQNRRTDYIAAWWNVVNWEQVEKNFRLAMKR
ncbi:MAG: superoxide dismutase [Candidatus Micrarchaeota archaeon]|nr:superoxide dismutase [Candidatus Micrarchaeota archaeon]